MIPEQQSAIDWTNLPPTSECRGRPTPAEDRVSECILEGCDKIPFRRRMCAMHYSRWLRNGHPDLGGRVARPAWERLWRRVEVVESGCWEWQGGKTKGYGHLQGTGRSGTLMAHRVAYEFMSGKPIPEGMTIDHLCRNRSCCNPAHLEVVTIGVNVLRGFANSAINKRKTHCKRGHEFTPENTKINKGKHGPIRECRACMPIHQANYKNRKKEQ